MTTQTTTTTTTPTPTPATAQRTLFGLRQSPWTERARWALDHHGIAYSYHEHVPMLGELFLRRKAKVKKASVPLFVDADGTVVMGSLEIAQHAERTGGGAPLFPEGKQAEVAHWADVAETLTYVARAWVLKRLASSRGAQKEALPSFIPGALRGLMAPSSGMALRFLAKKYELSNNDNMDAEVDRTMRPLLEEARKALSTTSTTYLLSTFSFADIAIASTLHAVRPHEGLEGVGPATREAWTNDALVRDFGDLLKWRDGIYDAHRRPSKSIDVT